MDVCMLAIA
jgi:hypothetical protein